MRGWLIWIWCGIATALLAAPRAHGQPYELSWSSVDGGGVTSSSGGTFSLGGTIGQADAGGAMAAGLYTLRGGFWAVIAPEPALRLFRASRSGPRLLASMEAPTRSSTGIGPTSRERASRGRGPGAPLRPQGAVPGRGGAGSESDLAHASAERARGRTPVSAPSPPGWPSAPAGKPAPPP